MFAAKIPSQSSLTRTINTIPIINWTAVARVNTASTLRFPLANPYVLHRRVHMNTRKGHAASGSPGGHENLCHQCSQDEGDELDDSGLGASEGFQLARRELRISDSHLSSMVDKSAGECYYRHAPFLCNQCNRTLSPQGAGQQRRTARDRPGDILMKTQAS